jgi:hypothetical protein
MSLFEMIFFYTFVGGHVIAYGYLAIKRIRNKIRDNKYAREYVETLQPQTERDNLHVIYFEGEEDGSCNLS